MNVQIATSLVLVAMAHVVLCSDVDQSAVASVFVPDSNTGSGVRSSDTSFGVYVVESLRDMNMPDKKIVNVLVTLLDEYREAYFEERDIPRTEKRGFSDIRRRLVPFGRKLSQNKIGSASKSNILRYG